MIYALLCVFLATYLILKAKVRPIYLIVCYTIMITKFFLLFVGVTIEKKAGYRTYQAFDQLLNFNFLDTFLYPAVINAPGIMISGHDGVVEVTNSFFVFVAAIIFSLCFKRQHQKVLLCLILMPSINYYSMTGLRDTLLYSALIIGGYIVKKQNFKWLIVLSPSVLMRPEVIIPNFFLFFSMKILAKIKLGYLVAFSLIIGVFAYFSILFVATFVIGFLTNTEDTNLISVLLRLRELRFHRQFVDDGGTSAYFTQQNFSNMSFAHSYFLQVWKTLFLAHGNLLQQAILMADNFIFLLISAAAYRHGDRTAFFVAAITFLLLCFFNFNYGNAFRMRIGITSFMVLSLVLGRR